MPKILVVEDDPTMATSIVETLQEAEFVVDSVLTGSDARDYLKSFQYDALVLDWDLPDVSGLELCRNFRSAGGTTPILILTGKQSASEIETGLDSGADDYLTKPFQARVLLARIRALLRRPSHYVGDKLRWRDVEIDVTTHTVTRAGKVISLARMEYTLLEFLMRHPDQVFSTDKLLRNCWEGDKDVSAESIYTCIRRVRKKIDNRSTPSIIQTVHAVGYRLESENE